jgi:hypothetical protein
VCDGSVVQLLISVFIGLASVKQSRAELLPPTVEQEGVRGDVASCIPLENAAGKTYRLRFDDVAHAGRLDNVQHLLSFSMPD